MIEAKHIHLAIFTLLCILSGCASEAPPEEALVAADSTETVQAAVANTIDPSVPPASDTSGAWGYRAAERADLDGDGTEEEIVLQARVEMRNGRPLWDDGQPWELRIEEPGGEHTRVYARYVQLGRPEVAIARDGDQISILLIERQGAGIRVFDIRYSGPGAFEATQLLERGIDRWVHSPE